MTFPPQNVSECGEGTGESTLAHDKVVTPDQVPLRVAGPPPGLMVVPDISSFDRNERGGQQTISLRPRQMGASCAAAFSSQRDIKRRLTMRRLEVLRLKEELCLTEMAELRCLDKVRAMKDMTMGRAHNNGGAISNPLQQRANKMLPRALSLPGYHQGPYCPQPRRQSAPMVPMRLLPPQKMPHRMTQAQVAQPPVMIQMEPSFNIPLHAPLPSTGCSSSTSILPTGPCETSALAARIERSQAVLGASRAAVAAAVLQNNIKERQERSRETHAAADRTRAALEGKIGCAKVAWAVENETKISENVFAQKKTTELEAAKEILRLGEAMTPPEMRVGANLGNMKRKYPEGTPQLYPQLPVALSVENDIRHKKRNPPRRPLSAYNLFFSEERVRILRALEKISETDYDEDGLPDPKKLEALLSQQEHENKEHIDPSAASAALMREHAAPRSAKKPRRPHRKTHGRIGFTQLAKLVGRRWKSLPSECTQRYHDLAQKDMERYRNAMMEAPEKIEAEMASRYEEEGEDTDCG